MKKYYVKTTSSGKEVTRVNVFIQGEDEKGVWGHYSGSVEDYMPHGPGHLEFIDGSEYIGDFFGGAFHGYGIFIRKNGKKIEGFFEDGISRNPLAKITIDDQIWMKYNLNVDKFFNGDPIPFVKSNEDWVKAGEEGKPAWCYYENDPENGKKYGRLYNWYAVNDPRGLAPKGWHIPSWEEWWLLANNYKNLGAKLKSRIGWANNGNGIDYFGFSGYPGGFRKLDGTFGDVEYVGMWWCTGEWSPKDRENTENSFKDAWSWSMHHNSLEVKDSLCDKGDGFSVRCLKNKNKLPNFNTVLSFFRNSLKR